MDWNTITNQSTLEKVLFGVSLSKWKRQSVWNLKLRKQKNVNMSAIFFVRSIQGQYSRGKKRKLVANGKIRSNSHAFLVFRHCRGWNLLNQYTCPSQSIILRKQYSLEALRAIRASELVSFWRKTRQPLSFYFEFLWEGVEAKHRWSGLFGIRKGLSYDYLKQLRDITPLTRASISKGFA